MKKPVSIFACLFLLVGLGSCGGSSGGGGSGGDFEPDGSHFLAFLGSFKLADAVTAEVVDVDPELGAIDAIVQIFTGEGVRNPEILEYIHTRAGFVKSTQGAIERNDDGEAKAPDTKIIHEFNFEVFDIRLDYVQEEDDLYVIADTAGGTNILLADAARDLVFAAPFPGEHLASIVDDADLEGWLAEGFLGDVIFVDKVTLATQEIVDSNNARSLGSTKNGVPLFAADGDIYSFDILTRVATQMWDGEPGELNSLMMDILGEGIVMGCQAPGETELDLFYLPVGELTDMPFHTVTGLELGGATSVAAAGGRVVHSSRFSDTNERRLESVTLDGVETQLLFSGADLSDILSNQTFMSEEERFIYLNTGMTAASLGSAHAIAVDGSETVTFTDANWAGVVLNPTLTGKEFDMAVRLDDSNGATLEVIGVDADDPTSEVPFGEAPANVRRIDLGLALGFPVLVAAELEDSPERDLFILRLLENEDPTVGAFVRLTNTPDVNEATFSFTPTF